MNARVASVLACLVFLAVPGGAQAQQASASKDSAALVVLNQGYINSFMKGDAAWYEAHLWPDYQCIVSSGTIISRADFVNGARQPMTYKSFGVDSVRVQLVTPDVALVSAITPYERPDGTKGVTRYTDTWVRRNGVWEAVRAQLTGIAGR